MRYPQKYDDRARQQHDRDAPAADEQACHRGVAFMTKIRGATNDRAKDVLGWAPSYESWHRGFEGP